MGRGKKNKKRLKIKISGLVKLCFAALLIAMIIKTFMFDTLVVTGSYMHPTIKKGDLVVVNKYLFGSKFFRRYLNLPGIKFPKIREPKKNDIILFEGEADKLYIGRCAGLPGETIQIIDKRIFINGAEQGSKFNYSDSVEFIMPKGIPDSRVEPAGLGWNSDNYGPLLIPSRNEVIFLGDKKMHYLKHIIGKEKPYIKTEFREGKLFADNKELKSYKVEQDFYFLLGDNKENTIDSRFIGLVPSSSILGKVEVILYPF